MKHLDAEAEVGMVVIWDGSRRANALANDINRAVCVR